MKIEKKILGTNSWKQKMQQRQKVVEPSLKK